MKLKIQTTLQITAPKGTKMITNGEWITLSRKIREGVIAIFTCPVEEISKHDLYDEQVWIRITKAELNKIVRIK